MNIQSLNRALLALSLLIVSSASIAASVYQWQDANGVTHFSDAPPPQADYANQVNSFEIETDFPEVQNPEENYYSISQQWERAKEDRLARQQLKLERDKLRTARLQQQQDVQIVSEEPRRTYFPVFSPAFNNPLLNRRAFNRRQLNQRFPQGFNNNFGVPFQGNLSGRPGRAGRMNRSNTPVHRGYVGNVAQSSSRGN